MGGKEPCKTDRLPILHALLPCVFLYRAPRRAGWTISFWQWALFLLGMVLKGKKLRGSITFFGWMALANGGHTPGGEVTFRVQAKAVCPERTMTAAAPALWIWAVRSAVILIAGLVLHETFKGAMIAIGKIHGIPPFGLDQGKVRIYK